MKTASFSDEEIKVMHKASTDFVYFVNHIFSKSSKHFIGGEHVDNTARFLASNRKTIRVSARNHFKSYAFYAHFMWKLMFEGVDQNIEAHYFSYNSDLASYHIGKLKSTIDANPYFRHIIDKKPIAESVLKYTWDGEHFTTLHPHGLVQFKRGIHCLAPNERITVRNPETGDIRSISIQSFSGEKFSEILTENGFKRVTHFIKRENKDSILSVTLLNGANMKITPDHPCLIKRDGIIKTASADSLLQTDLIPYKPQLIENDKKKIGSYDLGRFIGIYCGDGSRQSDKGIQLVNNPQKDTSSFVEKFARDNLGSNVRTVSYGTYERQHVPGKAALELCYRFVRGNSSRTKHLTSDIFNTSEEFRRGFVAGYLEADGTNKAVSTSSSRLAKDFCNVLSSLGIHYNLVKRNLVGGYGEENKDVKRTQFVISMDSKTNVSERPIFNRVAVDKDSNGIMWMPIKSIEISNRVPDYVYDVTVDSESHLFSLSNGIITHNCDIVYVDDPFQDPENELNPTIIHKINEIFKSNILDMPNEPDGELHVAGTPQTNEDFYYDKGLSGSFARRIQPAITEEGQALWPEWMDLPSLEQKRIERTDRIFQREYLCTPVYSTEGFFSKDYLKKKIVNPNLVSYKARLLYPARGELIAGFDIGKKSHPSHLSVFENYDNRLVMVHQKWMDGWSYSNGKEFLEHTPTQLEYLKMIIKNFSVKRLYYDNTKGEFEALDEQGLLPKVMVPVVFTQKLKQSMATAFDKLVEREQIQIIDDERMISQICSVRNDLQAIQSSGGHGDSFWSICLSLLGTPQLTNFVDDSTQAENRRRITTAGKSIFEESESIPSGW